MEQLYWDNFIHLYVIFQSSISHPLIIIQSSFSYLSSISDHQVILESSLGHLKIEYFIVPLRSLQSSISHLQVIHLSSFSHLSVIFQSSSNHNSFIYQSYISDPHVILKSSLGHPYISNSHHNYFSHEILFCNKLHNILNEWFYFVLMWPSKLINTGLLRRIEK